MSHALAESELLGVVASVQAALGLGPSPPGLQAPIRSVAAAKRTGQWEGRPKWSGGTEKHFGCMWLHLGTSSAGAGASAS